MSVSTLCLRLEALDARNAPSALVGNTPATTDWMEDPADTSWLPAYVALASTPPGVPTPGGGNDNVKPVITEFTVTINPGWVGVFSGRVTDESVNTVTVRFGGSPDCLQSATVDVDDDGTFEFQGQLVVPGDTGTAWAEPVDAQGLVGDYVERVVFVG